MLAILLLCDHLAVIRVLPRVLVCRPLDNALIHLRLLQHLLVLLPLLLVVECLLH